MRFSSFYLTAFTFSVMMLLSCGKDPEPPLPPDVELEIVKELKQKLYFKINYQSNHPGEYVRSKGLCTSYTNNTPTKEEGANVYLLYNKMDDAIDFVPGKTIYLRAFVEVWDEFAELDRVYYSETVTFQAPAKWHGFEPAVFFSSSNCVAEVVNENDLRIFSYHRQLQSTDLGETWTEIVDDLPDHEVLFVEFFSDNEAILIMNSPDEPIYRTTDGGVSWELITIEGIDNVSTGNFLNMNHGYVVTDQKQVHVTSNGGASWTNVTLVPMEGTDWVEQFVVIDDLHAILATKNGHIHQTFDGGASWGITNFSSPIDDFAGFYFFDINHGFILSGEQILETWDGGMTTTERFYSSTDSSPYFIAFTNNLNGYVLGQNGTAFKTTDGGTSWFTMMGYWDTDIDGQFKSFEMFSDSLGFATATPFNEIAVLSNKSW